VKKNAENTSGFSMSGLALSIWDNSLPIRTRVRLKNIIKLAGLKPVALAHENTAAVAY